jgi:hypothetical protein
LCTEVAVVNDTLNTAEINIPIDTSRNVGIVIWGVEHEPDHQVGGAATDTNADEMYLIISKNSIAAEVFVSNKDVVYKWGLHFTLDSAIGSRFTPKVIKETIYPPCLIFQDDLQVGCMSMFGSHTWRIRLNYSIAWVSKEEMMSLLKNSLI